MTKIEMGKKYKTRDGREVRIYDINPQNYQSVHGAIKSHDGRWLVMSWWPNGQALTSGENPADLIEVKERFKKVVWVNVYHGMFDPSCYDSKEAAHRNALPSRTACIPITIDCEEGEGLE